MAFDRARAAGGAFMVGMLFLGAEASAQSRSEPIIDVHLHADPVANFGPPGQMFCMEQLRHTPPHDPAEGSVPQAMAAHRRNPGCERPMPAAANDQALMEETLSVLKRRNIIGVVGGPADVLRKWKEAAPDHVIASRSFSLGGDADVSLADLAADHAAGDFEVIGEVTNQYRGHAPDAPGFDPYWAMAEERDIPVGIHIGGMPPGAAYWGQGARVAVGDPLLLEDVLIRHPKLRVYIMHAGLPMFDRTIALMHQYPQVYAGTGVLQAVMTRSGYEAFLKKMVDAGLEKRLMYGTDQMIWPGMIERSLSLVEESEVLTPAQKRDILYNNAARFLRLDAATIERHHEQAKNQPRPAE